LRAHSGQESDRQGSTQGRAGSQAFVRCGRETGTTPADEGGKGGGENRCHAQTRGSEEAGESAQKRTRGRRCAQAARRRAPACVARGKKTPRRADSALADDRA